MAKYLLAQPLKDRIDKLGFSTYGVVDLEQLGGTSGKWLNEFIAKDYHGSMAWMKETAFRRSHPKHLWAHAKSALVLGFNYGPDTDPMANLSHTDQATISVYARNKDYHALIKGKLKELASLMARDTGKDVKVFVDTAPLMEKPLAALAGIGWQGKHTNLVSREFGSWLFLGVILSEAELEPTQISGGDCGSCTACLDICPTNAFPAPYKLDARLCISYLTIEHKGPVDEDLRPKLGNRIYGCDDCLAVCPWNKFAQHAREQKLVARADLNAPDLEKLAALDDAEFRTLFSGSPIKRIGLDRFLRNVLYAIGNSKNADFKKTVTPHLSHNDPVVRDAAEWALAQLS
ncbi:MAG: tRNA epoxyqueuosine(34) reductase QueG [Robiginitomaculum sp.]|nr:MAG: tRNA epoxyqueuosine(34) reductase QueG [Robiginitomaculum sp.]